MSDKIVLECSTRTVSGKEVRKENLIPANYYAKGKENINLQMGYHDFRRVFEKSGYSTIVDLKIDGKKEIPVLVHDVDLHPIKDTFYHVDFFGIKMGEEITTAIPIKLIGTAPAIKELGGILMHGKEEIEVTCLPKNLIHEIEVDISELVDFNCSIKVADLKVPSTIRIDEDKDLLIATVGVSRQATEAEEKVAEEEEKEEEKEENNEEEENS